MQRCLLLSMALLLAACNSMTSQTVIATPVVRATVTHPIHIPHARITYYDVTGTTEIELRHYLDRLRPINNDGHPSDAMTKWSIRWNWQGYGSPTCNLATATVTYDITVTLPRWQPPEKASSELVTKWGTYLQALVEHEQQHVDLVVANIPTIREAIQQATCETAEEAAQAAHTRIQQLSIEYDAVTEHGLTQGARFP